VPVLLKAPAVGAFVVSTIVIVCGGLAPFAVEPPRLGVVKVSVAPAGIAPGAAQLTCTLFTKQVGTPPLFIATVKLLMFRVAELVTVKTTFWAVVVETLLTTHVMLFGAP
jgi:ABC-type multidrug transport system permease subunit